MKIITRSVDKLPNKKVHINKNYFSSIRGRMFIMGAASVTISIIIGGIGIVSVGRNNTNSSLERNINEINMLQSNSEAEKVLYRYHLDNTYLNNIRNNLTEMSQLSQEIKKSSNGTIKTQIDSVSEDISSVAQNYNQLIDLTEVR